MKTIKTNDNTFYVKKTLTDDIGILPCYADAYIGLSTNFDITSNPDTSFYLGESSTVSNSDFVYGEGAITEMYLSLYVDDLIQKNPQTANWLDVYSIKPHIDITEGNLTIASGNYGGQTLFYNSANNDGNWITEDFDGVNKDFMDGPLRAKKLISVISPGLRIKYGKLLNLALATNRDPPQNEYTWANPIKNLGEELSAVKNWGSYYLGNMGTTIMTWTREELFGKDSALDELVSLEKGSDGLYAPPTYEGGSILIYADTYPKRLEMMRKPSTWWVENGALWESSVNFAGTAAIAADYSVLDETFVGKCTQENSIFSDSYESPNVRDIKDQTLEGPGDTPTFIAYAYQNLVNAESPTDGLCLRMKCFWENFSGSAEITGDNAWNTANPFGRYTTGVHNISAYPQVVHNSIYGIPQPTPIDITTSGTGYPAYAPEIELVFKINRMDVSTYMGSGSGVGGASVGQHLSLDRSVNIIFNDDAPMAADGGDEET